MEKQTIKTPLGLMTAVSKGLSLIALSFEDSFDVLWGDSDPLRSIANELSLYFKGELTEFKTPLGLMTAVSKGLSLIALSFEDSFDVLWGDSDPLRSIANELSLYFKGELTEFKTPLSFETGTPFQQKVWRELAKIPFGATRSYAQIATAIGRPKAVRAGAQANGANPLAIVIPCHRVIQSDGLLGGYSGKIERKQWLLDWESAQSRG